MHVHVEHPPQSLSFGSLPNAQNSITHLYFLKRIPSGFDVRFCERDSSRIVPKMLERPHNCVHLSVNSRRDQVSNNPLLDLWSSRNVLLKTPSRLVPYKMFLLASDGAAMSCLETTVEPLPLSEASVTFFLHNISFVFDAKIKSSPLSVVLKGPVL